MNWVLVTQMCIEYSAIITETKSAYILIESNLQSLTYKFKWFKVQVGIQESRVGDSLGAWLFYYCIAFAGARTVVDFLTSCQSTIFILFLLA